MITKRIYIVIWATIVWYSVSQYTNVFQKQRLKKAN